MLKLARSRVYKTMLCLPYRLASGVGECVSPINADSLKSNT